MSAKLLSLREVVEPILGGYWGETVAPGAGNARVIRNGDVRESGEIGKKVPERILSDKEITKARLRPGDVRMTISGNVGRVARVTLAIDGDGKPYVASSFVKILRAKKNILPEYLFFFLRRAQFQKELQKYTRGVAIQNLSVQGFDQKFIPDIPIREQERIVAILEETEELKRKRAEADRKMSDISVSAFLKLLNETSGASAEGTFDDFDVEIIDGDRGKNYPKRAEFSQDGFCLFLNTKNIVDGEFVFSDSDFVGEERHRAMGKGEVKAGDIVMTTRGTVGNTAYFNGNLPYKAVRINPGMVIFRRSERNFNPLYLHFYLTSALFKRQYLKKGSGSAQPQLSIKDLRRLRLIKLPRAAQDAFAKTLKEINEMRTRQRQAARYIDELFSSLLSTTFESEPSFVTEPATHPQRA